MNHIKNRPTPETNRPKSQISKITLPDPNLIEKMSPWRIDFRQLEPGQMQTRVRVRSGRILSVLEISMNRGVHQRGAAPPDTLTFGVPLSSGLSNWQGTNAQAGSFLTFGGGDGFEWVSDNSFHGVTFSVSNTQIEALADRLGIPLEQSLRSSGFFCATQGISWAHRLSAMGLGYLDHSDPLGLGYCHEEEILAVFLAAAARPEILQDQSTGNMRSRAVKIALEIMEPHADENLPISRICSAAGVSLRTLNRAFREKFGVGPKAYFLRFRLRHIRRELIRNDGSELVSEIANQWGFWHMGQMARDYRSQFGELPSETKG